MLTVLWLLWTGTGFPGNSAPSWHTFLQKEALWSYGCLVFLPSLDTCSLILARKWLPILPQGTLEAKAELTSFCSFFFLKKFLCILSAYVWCVCTTQVPGTLQDSKEHRIPWNQSYCAISPVTNHGFLVFEFSSWLMLPYSNAMLASALSNFSSGLVCWYSPKVTISPSIQA